MSRVVLIQALPRDPATGATIAVRMAGGGERAYTHLGVTDWMDGVVDQPRFTAELGFDETGWTGAAIPQTGSIGFAPNVDGRAAALARLVWSKAQISVLVGDDAVSAPAWQTLLNGTVAGLSTKSGVLAFTISDLSGVLAKPVCQGFTGTGGIEGGTDAVGRVKRRSWGRVFNVEGRLLDSTTNIYEFGDPAFPIRQFVSVKDRGRDGTLTVIAWQGSVADTLAALKAATVPDGGAVVAPSIACVKWWDQPAGPLTADLLGEVGTGYVETAPGIAASVVASVSTVQLTGLAAAQAIRPDPAGLHVDSATETAGQALDRLLFGASLLWSMTPQGAVQLLPIGYDNPVEVVDFDSVERDATYPPVVGVKVGYALNNRVQSDAEISASVLAGDVTGLGPLAVAPSIHFGSPLLLETDSGAAASLANFKTSLGVASSITGQGAFATLNSAAYGSSLLTGFGALAPLGSVSFGSSYLLEGTGGALATLPAFKTALGIASAITGQGPFATGSSYSLLTNLPGVLSAGLAQSGARILADRIGFFGSDGAFQASINDLRPAQVGADATGKNTASAITGQGAFATISSAAYGSSLLTGFGALSPLSSLWFGSGLLTESAGGTGATLGAFKTALGTASAIVGQSAFATYAQTTPGALLAPASNMIFDSTFRFGGLRWAGSSAFGYSQTGYDANGFAYLQQQDAAGAVVKMSPAITVAGGAQYCLQGEMAFGGTGGSMSIDVVWFDASNAASYSERLRISQAGLLDGTDIWGKQGNYYSLYRPITAPASAVRAQVRILTEDLAGGTAYWRKLKLALGSNPTTWSDEATTSANYADGASMDGLRPGEKNANVTEGRTAAAIAGQGSLATQNQTRYNDQISNLPPSLLYANMFNSGGVYYIAATSVAWSTGDGASVESTRPQERGANVTEVRTAAAFTGQGAFATLSTLDRTSSRLTGFGSLAGRNKINLGVPSDGTAYLANQSDSYVVTDAHAITALGVASAITGQSSWATYGGTPAQTIDQRTQNLNSSGNAPAYMILNGGVPLSDVYPAQAGADRTSTQTAAAVTGQGPFATASGGQSLDNTGLFGMPTRLAGSGVNGNYLSSTRMLYDGGSAVVSIDSLRPAQAGADTTGLNTAAAIAGQGSLATANNINSDAQLGGVLANRLRGSPADTNYVAASQVAWDGGDTVQRFRPQEPGSNVTEARTAAAITGQSAFATAPMINGSNVAAYFQYSAFQIGYSITRSDGNTIVTESMVYTAYGVAAGFVGQGRGATANSLSDLDSNAASQLNNLAGNVATSTIGIGIGNSSIIQRSIAAGATAPCSAQVRIKQNNSANGAAHLTIQVSPSGTNNWSNVAVEDSAITVGSDGPASGTASGTVKNTSSSTMLFDFRTVVTAPSGSNADSTASFLKA